MILDWGDSALRGRGCIVSATRRPALCQSYTPRHLPPLTPTLVSSPLLEARSAMRFSDRPAFGSSCSIDARGLSAPSATDPGRRVGRSWIKHQREPRWHSRGLPFRRVVFAQHAGRRLVLIAILSGSGFALTWPTRALSRKRSWPARVAIQAANVDDEKLALEARAPSQTRYRGQQVLVTEARSIGECVFTRSQYTYRER